MRRSSEADFVFKANEYSGELRVLKFSGEEGISELFKYSLELASRDANIDFDSIISKPACLNIIGESGTRYVNGIVSKFVQAGSGNEFTFYHAELVPLLWLMTLRHDCRIFQNKSIEEVITEVFQEDGIPSENYKFALQEAHVPHEYCVQYRESDFNFISRLMEEEGIFYFFEHKEDNHIMVISDNPSAHIKLDPFKITFREVSGLVQEQDFIYDFRFIQQIRPNAVTLRDFNYERPSLEGMEVNYPSQKERLEIYDYPGDYADPGIGNDLAKIRLESLRTDSMLGSGQSVCRKFVPGYRFTMDSHPRSSFNQEYVITRLSSFGSQPLGEDEVIPDDERLIYSNRFDSIPFSVPYRPLRKTPKAIIDGVQTATVVGPSGDDIYFDQFGRVKIQFHWDRDGRKDENSSCWVRVSDGYAGQKHGIQFTPLIGDEVIVSFVEGDPDRPIITGRVYNGDNRPHLEPQNRIQNQILTPYHHRLLFDDKSKLINLRTGGGEQVTMFDGGKDYNGNIIRITTVDGHQIQLIESPDDKGILIITVKGNTIRLDDQYNNISIFTPTDHHLILDDDNKRIEIKSTNGHRIVIDDETNSITAIDSSEQHIIQIASDGKKITIESQNGDIDILAPSGAINMNAGSINMSAGSITGTASGDIKLESANINAQAKADVNIEAGAQVKSNSGAPTQINSGSNIDITAGGIITILGSLVKIN